MPIQLINFLIRAAISLLYLAAGALHIASPAGFMLITPDWVPFKAEVILATGVCEIAGAIGLWPAATRRYACYALALYAACVFPANLKHAFYDVDVPGLPRSWWYHGPRLLAQPLLIWLTLFVSRVRVADLGPGESGGQAIV